MRKERVKIYLKTLIQRLFLLVFGVTLIGFSVFLLRLANFGTDSFTTMNLGISYFLGASFGNLQLVVNAILLIIVGIINKKFIGIGTIANMVLVGYISDFFLWLFLTYSLTPLHLLVRVILLIWGVILAGAGVAMYMHSETGTGPYDALPVIIENKTNKRVSFQVGRVFLDLFAVIIGFMFGATVGIGTILTAFFMGPIIQYFRKFLKKLFVLTVVPT